MQTQETNMSLNSSQWPEGWMGQRKRVSLGSWTRWLRVFRVKMPLVEALWIAYEKVSQHIVCLYVSYSWLLSLIFLHERIRNSDLLSSNVRIQSFSLHEYQELLWRWLLRDPSLSFDGIASAPPSGPPGQCPNQPEWCVYMKCREMPTDVGSGTVVASQQHTAFPCFLM